MNRCRRCGNPGPVIDGIPRAWCSIECKDLSLGRDRPFCSQRDCDKPVKLHGLCVTHYFRQKDRIAGARREARKRGVEAEQIDRDAVGDRDEWRCGICRRRVYREVKYPSPRSASLDHVVPLSQGGTHLMSNVRISHLECNVRRGNRGGGEQLALIG